MKPDKIRVIAICVFRNGNKILAFEGYDVVKQQTYYRPLGGRVEFGEYSDQAIAREIREEINAEVTDLCYLGTLENIFIYEGQKGHEIVQVYDGRFVDESLYDKNVIFSVEKTSPFRAVWLDLDKTGPGSPPLYPPGLLELLEETKIPA
ncbi:MAG: NUDIX hydrolase [Anaerolineales bacterium]|nr:NUDIX hydrolase [Anaerolineales bacterium]MCX7756634.1 NUDIX hydrolase [Anaerolineales bacterium]MDW8277291.1 NUDIX hydrolase [Anaerolineales bacterium]